VSRDTRARPHLGARARVTRARARPRARPRPPATPARGCKDAATLVEKIF